MNEILTIQEIEMQYNSEWVLMEDPELTPQMEIARGKVLYHSKNRDEVYQRANELRPKHSAYYYTGKAPDNMVIVL
jgi:hypothetical protein